MRGSVNDIARSIFAPRERDEAATSSYVATAVTDSSDGTVTVSVSGQVVEVRTTSDVRAGDSVLVQASRHRLTATGAVGGGDRTQAEVRAASEDAARARADAAEALAHAGG
uniref:hypothetical protein n=1 Tax=Olsenella uli TaxID=133926 RepID=UPI0028E3288D